MKKLLPIKQKLFLLLCVLLFTYCQDEYVQEDVVSSKEDIEETKSPLSIHTINDLPDLVPVIHNVSKRLKAGYASRNNTFEEVDLDYDKIIKFIDAKNVESYSFKIIADVDLNNPFAFENLHFVKNENDSYDVFILKYEPEEEWLEQNDFIFDFGSYTGKIRRFDLDYVQQDAVYFHNGKKETYKSSKKGDTTMAEIPCTWEFVGCSACEGELIGVHDHVETLVINCGGGGVGGPVGDGGSDSGDSGGGDTSGGGSGTSTDGGGYGGGGNGGGSGAGGDSSDSGGSNSDSGNVSVFPNYDVLSSSQVFSLKRTLRTTSEQNQWIDAHVDNEVFFIYVFLDVNDFSEEAKAEAKKMVEFEMYRTSSTKVVQTNKYPQEIASCCPGDCCPDPETYARDQIMMQYGITPIQAGIDGAFNLIVATTELIRSDWWVGSRVRLIMEEIDVEVPSDISNESLGQIFQIRKRDGVLVVEYRPGIVKSLINLGLDTLDVLAILSPSKGGGAFLAVRGGGKITTSTLTDYLRVLSKGGWKTVNESMSDAAKSYQEFITGRKWNESFELNDVKFDGLKDGVLSDAKSGMKNFVDASTGKFHQWFIDSPTGGKALMEQAQRQIAAAEGIPIEWHFEFDEVRNAVAHLFIENGIGFVLKYTPK